LTERGRLLRRTAIAEHALIPRLAGKPVGFVARGGGAFSRRLERTAENGFA